MTVNTWATIAIDMKNMIFFNPIYKLKIRIHLILSVKFISLSEEQEEYFRNKYLFIVSAKFASNLISKPLIFSL